MNNCNCDGSLLISHRRTKQNTKRTRIYNISSTQCIVWHYTNTTNTGSHFLISIRSNLCDVITSCILDCFGLHCSKNVFCCDHISMVIIIIAVVVVVVVVVRNNINSRQTSIYHRPHWALSQALKRLLNLCYNIYTKWLNRTDVYNKYHSGGFDSGRLIKRVLNTDGH